MGSIQVWEGMDLDVLDEMDKEVKSATSTEFWKPEVGENVVRFLPKLKGQKSHVKIVYEHFVDDVPGRDGIFRFVCPRNQTKGRQPCPLCDQADTFKKSRNPADHDRAKELYPQMRIYANIIDRSQPELGPRVFAFGKTIWEQLKKIATSKHQGGDYTSPGENGFDVVIDRTGTGKNDTRYTVLPAREDSPLSKDKEQLEQWITGQWALESYAVVLDGPELMNALRGGSPGRGGRTALPAGNGRTSRALPDTTRRARRTAQDDVESGGAVIDVSPDDDEDDVPL